MTINLVYMAKPIYGGWVTFTAHLGLKYNCNLIDNDSFVIIRSFSINNTVNETIVIRNNLKEGLILNLSSNKPIKKNDNIKNMITKKSLLFRKVFFNIKNSSKKIN